MFKIGRNAALHRVYGAQPRSSSSNDSSTSTASITQNMDSLSLTEPTTPHPFPFLALPAEIRNKIYAFTWLASRDKDSTYNLPDVIVTAQGLRWTNIPAGFALFQTSQQTRSESIAAVSRECFAEIKLYPDPYVWVPQPRVVSQLQASFFRSLSLEARRVSLDISSQRWKQWECDVLLSAVVEEVKSMLPKLEEVAVKLDASNCVPGDMADVKDVFRLVRKRGVVLTFELFYKPMELEESKQTWEEMIWYGARACGVPDAEIWIEWTRKPDEPHLERPGCVCGNCYR